MPSMHACDEPVERRIHGLGRQAGVTMSGDTRLTAMRFASRCAWMACCVVGMLSLSACKFSEYPDDWPGRAWGLFSRKGDCPDLMGEYDGVDEQLLSKLHGWMENGNLADYVDHKVNITQADDGAWIKFEFAVDEQGLAALEARKGGSVLAPYASIAWTRGRQYRCENGGLFVNATYDTEFARDRSGALIAHWTRREKGSLRVGSTDIPTGTGVHNGWRRWTARDPARNAALETRGHFRLGRADLKKDDDSARAYFTSFFSGPLCVRYVRRDAYEAASRTFLNSREADPARPQSWDCPAGWGGMDAGTTFDMEMRFPVRSGDLHRIEWFRLGDTPDQAGFIEIHDVRGLPVSGEQAPLRIGQASVRVN